MHTKKDPPKNPHGFPWRWIVPSNHDITREQLRDAHAPVPQNPELLTVALQEAQRGPHQVPKLHASGAVVDGRRLLTGEEESLKDRRRRAEVSRCESAHTRRGMRQESIHLADSVDATMLLN